MIFKIQPIDLSKITSIDSEIHQKLMTYYEILLVEVSIMLHPHFCVIKVQLFSIHFFFFLGKWFPRCKGTGWKYTSSVFANS